MTNINTIIFDLGGVIINLDIPRTTRAFEALGAANFGESYSQLAQTPLFDAFDKGLVSETVFFTNLKQQFDLPQPIAQLEQAWNAMLLDFPALRLEQLQDYKQRYNLFLLSNTNTTHVQAFEKTLWDSHKVANLQPFFHKVYYSCDIGLRKPDAEIFEFVLADNGLKPEATVFIDDTLMHVEAARSLGIKAVHLPKGEEFSAVLEVIL
jgi:putative hydrolase of the HAD superfamily